jgi:hypothetical protein
MKLLRESQYLTLKKDYDGKKGEAVETFKKKKKDFVQRKLHQFDQLIKAFDEKTKWG